MRRSQCILSLLCLASAVVVAGCGSSDDDDVAGSSGGPGTGGLLGTGGNATGGGTAGSAAGGEAAGSGNVGAGGTTVRVDGGSAGKGNSGSGGTGGSGGSAGTGGTANRADSGTATDAAIFVPTDGGPSSGRQTARPLGSNNNAPNGYYEYLPAGYDGSVAAPLLVFWHGIGEDGNGSTDLHNVLNWGPPKVIANNKWDNSRPFIVLSPQYTSQMNGGIAPGAGCPSSSTIDTFFTWALGHYNVDRKRVYLTGLSCGAIGSWDYLSHFQATVVAAVVPLSGNPGDPTQPTSAWGHEGCALGSAAIWSFHGDADPTVPYAPDHDTLQDLMACPVPPRRPVAFTDVVGGGHIIWDPIYDLSGGYGDIYAWMLTNAKP